MVGVSVAGRAVGDGTLAAGVGDGAAVALRVLAVLEIVVATVVVVAWGSL